MDDKCSVWVGSLSLNVEEETLSDLFGKFGRLKCVVILRDEFDKSRQFGFVSYYSSEVAECAATVMHGYIVLGQAIKTKGPQELQKLRHEQNGSRDYRLLTDCLFFIDDRDCTWKSGECPFRHCNNAKKTKKVCEKWLERQCEEVECPNRHPRLTKTPGKVNAEDTITRCPSHNAFKCFGECGNKDCNTHFLEHSAYQEHVKMTMKKLSQPVGTCFKCQAVFFKQDEMLNHRCYKNVINQPRSGALLQFTSTRMPAEKDIANPQPLYPKTYSAHPNNIEQPVHTQLTNKSQGSTEIRIDKEYSSIYNRKDNEKIPSSIFSGDSSAKMKQWTSQKLCDSNKANHMKSLKELEPVGVFWDFENCSIPKAKSAQAVVQKIRKEFFKDKREVEFMCVCDTSKEKKAVMEELNKAQVTVVHINATSKNAADDKLRQSLRRFAQTFSRPATVILISGDGNFAVDLSDLRHRHNFQIICLHNIAASSALLSFAHETHRFDLFTENLHTASSGQPLYKPSFSNDVLITNLPVAKSATQLKARLTKLSDNCGGKVVQVNRDQAIIRFPNAEAARRARRRLDKEELFGYILNASLLRVTSNKESTNMLHVGKRKQRENTNSAVNQSTSTTAKPLMDLNLNDNPKSWKENQSPNNVNHSRNFPHENLRRDTPPFRIPEPRPVMSPQFACQQFSGQQLHGFPGNFTYNNMFHPTLVHNVFGLRGGDPRISNSPIPVASSLIPSIPSPISRPPSSIATTPPQLSPLFNSVGGRSPSPEQQYNGVGLLVTNINENISKKEIKKKLASVFREHCKVYSVVLHAKKGAPLRAFVKVPKITDAHQAISKVTGKTILGQVVHVCLASEKDKEMCYLQDQAVTVLQDAPLGWLPSSTFFTNFEKKYRRHLDSRYLEQLQDVVVINGSPGCQTVSLVEGKIHSETVMVDDSFSSDVFKLLHHYDGVIMFISFPALYWLEFHKEIKLCSTGVILEELLCRIPNVTVVDSAGERCVQWARKLGSSSGDLTDLSLLRTQLVHILQQDHEFEMTFERLQDKYLSSYDKQLDPRSFGFQSLADLLHSLSTIVQVKEDLIDRHVFLIREYRVKLFQIEIEELLQEQPRHSVLLSNFMALYVKHFGKKFKISSFGFTRLTDLIKAVSGVAKIEGIGDLRTVSLIRKEDDESSKQSELDELTRRIEALLNDSEDKEMEQNHVLDCYFEQHGERLSCSRYGCNTMDELLSRLSNTCQVVERGDDKFLRLHDNIHSVDDIKADLYTLVNNQENNLVHVKNIFKLYENLFGRKCPYEISLLNEALESIDKPLQILGNENDRIIIILKDEAKHSDVDFMLFKTAVEILYLCEGYCLPKDNFQESFENVRKNKNVIEDDTRLHSIPSCVVVRKKSNEEMVGLKHSYCVRILVEELKQLLGSLPELSLSLDELPTRYEEYFKKKLNLESHGLLCPGDLKEELNGFIEVTSSGENADHSDRITLSSISRFELETRTLLDNCGGCLSLSRFAPVYQQMYSKPCIVSEYGYTKLSSLINAVPHVARIIGSGPEKAVIAVERSIPERVVADMLSVRIIGGSTEEIASVRRDKDVPLSCNLELGSCTKDQLSDEVSHHNSSLPHEKLQEPCMKVSKNLEEGKVSISSLKCDVDLPDTVKTVATPSSTYNVELTQTSPAGQGKTTKPKQSNNFSTKKEHSTARTTPSKIRLAANFNFPRNAEK